MLGRSFFVLNHDGRRFQKWQWNYSCLVRNRESIYGKQTIPSARLPGFQSSGVQFPTFGIGPLIAAIAVTLLIKEQNVTVPQHLSTVSSPCYCTSDGGQLRKLEVHAWLMISKIGRNPPAEAMDPRPLVRCLEVKYLHLKTTPRTHVIVVVEEDTSPEMHSNP